MTQLILNLRIKADPLFPATLKNKDLISNDESASDEASGSVGCLDGQRVHLWLFLVELLINKKDHKNIIEWSGTNGVFRFLEPERVAYLWGLRKNKENMTFQTLSRGLRYYYTNGLMKKLNSERFLYQFLFDLELLLGYSVQELTQLSALHSD